MRGEIYQLAFNGDGGTKHPHLVILEITGSAECVVFPGYGADGHMIRQKIAALKKIGYREDEIFVELDNAQCVDFAGKFSGKKCFWMIARTHRLMTKTVTAGERIGKMKAPALKTLTEALLALAKVRSELLSPKLLKHLQALTK